MSPPDPENRKTVTELIRNFRSIRIAVFAPPSSESDDFLLHLQRMGSKASLQWPPPAQMPQDVDVVFLAVRPSIEEDIEFNWDVEDPPAALIAVVDYENPLIVEAVLNLNVQATIGMPFRPFGLMINVLLSMAKFKREQKLVGSNQRLKAKLTTLNDTERAKSIVSQKYAVDGDTAYNFIRKHAMNKRTSVETIVQEIIAANAVLELVLSDI